MELFGPVLPGNGIPRSRPLGRVCAASGNARTNPIRIARLIRMCVVPFRVRKFKLRAALVVAVIPELHLAVLPLTHSANRAPKVPLSIANH